MNRHTLAAAALVLVACALSTPVHGQRTSARRPASIQRTLDRTTGLMIGVHTLVAPGVGISGEDVRSDFHTNLGGGVGAMIGYGFSPIFSAFGALDLAKQGSGMDDLQGSFGLVHFELGARANLPMGSAKTLPYVSASVGRRALGARITDYGYDEEYEASFSGGFFALGAGIQRFISPATALEGGVSVGFGSFDRLAIDGDEDDVDVGGSTSVRFRFGVVWRP